MKKIINRPEDFVDEMLAGILAAHPESLKATTDPRAIVRADAPVEGQVAILTGGGSGHLPVFLGYVGKGLASGVAVGNVFSSPSAETMYEATLAAHGGEGVIYLYGNYSGDVMNFDMAAEMAAMDDIRVETVLVSDDVARRREPMAAPKGRGRAPVRLQRSPGPPLRGSRLDGSCITTKVSMDPLDGRGPFLHRADGRRAGQHRRRQMEIGTGPASRAPRP